MNENFAIGAEHVDRRNYDAPDRTNGDDLERCKLEKLGSRLGLGTHLPTVLAKHGTCSARSMNTSSASSPVPKAKRAGSSIPRPRSLKLWWRFSPHTTARSMTHAVAPVACSCNPRSSSKPTAANWAMSLSTGRNPTPPPGASPP